MYRVRGLFRSSEMLLNATKDQQPGPFASAKLLILTLEQRHVASESYADILLT